MRDFHMLKWRLVTYIGFLKQSWYYLFCKKCVRGLAPFRKGFPMQISISIIIFAMAVILAGSCIQSALGFGTTMITMGFLPLVMPYSKAMGLSIIMVSISTLYISIKYRKHIRWAVMLPVLIPTVIICGTVNVLSAKVSSNVMYLLLGFMFVAVSIFFFVFSQRIHIRPTPVSGGVLGVITDRKEENLDAEIEELIQKRQEARKAKDFKTADAIRDQLNGMGIILEDTKEGVKWKRA